MSQATDFAGLCKQARKCCREREFAAAVELFEKALELEEQADVHSHLATAAFMAGDVDKAIEHFIRVTRMEPRNAQAQINLGAVYNRKNEFDKAIQALRKGLSFDMRCAEGYFNLGIAHRRLDQAKLAIPAFREAIRLDPKMIDAYVNLASIYLEQENFKQSIVLAQKALDLDSRYQAAQRVLDDAEANRSSAHKSAQSLDKIAGVSPPNKTDAQFRDLSDEDRASDRRELLVMAHTIAKLASEFQRHLQNALDPATRQVNRTMFEAKQGRASLVDIYEPFQDALNRYGSIRHRLGDKMRELRDHEERMKSNPAVGKP